MNAINTESKNFNWDRLLERIESNNVIPVIGHGLYWIEREGKQDVLLYDWLTEKLAQETGTAPQPENNHRFLNMALEFLKKYRDDYLKLSKFLDNLINDVTLTTANPLWKLARIKSFGMFINTGYDDFLADTIRTVRDSPVTALNHTLNEKKFNRMTDPLFDAMDNRKTTLVYNIFGN
ncbi:MAG: hypothetical protein GY940_38625 [bacterium]|nr:hypothetical protein [bacterium]